MGLGEMPKLQKRSYEYDTCRVGCSGIFLGLPQPAIVTLEATYKTVRPRQAATNG